MDIVMQATVESKERMIVFTINVQLQTRKKRVFCPESENIKEEALKDIIKQTAQYFKVNEEDIIRQFEDVLKEIEMDLDEDSIQGIEEKIQSNRSKLEKLVDLYMEGLIDKEIYFIKKKKLKKKLMN